MPQLVKGGKNTFGWTRVNEKGKIVIPPDAFDEYRFSKEKYIYLIPGSKKSGGFGLTTLNLLKTSQLSGIFLAHPELENPESMFNKCIKYQSRIYSVVPLLNRSITVPLEVLKQYGVKNNSLLLTVRGSYIALGFISKGPIIEEAKKHPELKVYE